jgi:hypothetical protein
MKDKPHQLRRLSTVGRVPLMSCRGMDSPQIPHRDAELLRYLHLRRAGADGSDPSRCAARTALSVSGKSSASFSTSAMVAGSFRPLLAGL